MFIKILSLRTSITALVISLVALRQRRKKQRRSGNHGRKICPTHVGLNQLIVSKAIGDYIYTIENHGFNNYRIIGKVPIEYDFME